MLLFDNPFYTDDDCSTVKLDGHKWEIERFYRDRLNRGKAFRTPFQRDLDNLTFCGAFRRLQGKTQVRKVGPRCFSRTRLSHSIEVASIARAIVSKLHILADRQSGRFVDGDLVEFACFAHDIGNPPFGHAGERELNGLMKECGGFEGNAQSLRIITETAWSSRGIRPTKASIDSILKYKESWRIKEDPPEQRSKFLYDYQDQLIEIIAVGKERSIECQIMDLADDIGNALIDFTDGVRAGIITKEKVRDWKSSEAEPDDDFAITNVLKAFDDNVMDIFSSVRVRDCVGALEFSGGADPDRRGNCSVWPNRDYAAFLRSLKRISSHFLFNDPEIRGQDNFGAFIIRTLFNIFVLHYCERGSDILYRTGIVPQDRHERLQTGAKDSKLRLICDYLSGMTDDYAELMFQRAVEIAL